MIYMMLICHLGYKNELVNDAQGNNRLCFEIYTEHINTLWGQNTEFVYVQPGGT
jgi:hypothetical protein